MRKLHSNIPLTIFVTGVILFLLAPLELISSITANNMAMAGLLIESLGITAGFMTYFRDKLAENQLKGT